MRFTFPFNLSFWLGVLCFFLCISESTNAQQPTVQLSLDKSEIPEAGGKAVVTAWLSAPQDKDVTLFFKPLGTAKYQTDFVADFIGKGVIKTIAGGNGAGSGPNQLNQPQDIHVDDTGNLFISDYLNSRVQKWEPGATSGRTVAGGNGYGSSGNQLSYPSGIFVDSVGNLFISDLYNHRVQKWEIGASSGSTVAGGNGFGSAANQLCNPYGIYVNRQGHLFIADYCNHRIQKWEKGSLSGISVAGGLGYGYYEGHLGYPMDVFVDNRENLIISDYGNYRVQMWAPGARFGFTLLGRTSTSLLNRPVSTFVDNQGNIFVAELVNHSVRKWSPSSNSIGLTVAGGNGPGDSPNQLNSPFGIFVDNQGNLFISDSGNNRIQKVINQPHIVIPAGELSGEITLSAEDDAIFEGNEVIQLDIERIENAYLDSSQSVIQITILENDEAPIVILSLSDSTLLEEGPSIDLRVQLSSKSILETKVQLGFSGTSVLGTHYKVESQEVFFSPGDSISYIRLDPIDNSLVEPIKTLVISVIGGENIAQPYPSTSIFVSSDDKPEVRLTFDKTHVAEEGGKAILTASLSKPHSRDVTVFFKTQGTAKYGHDYSVDFFEKEMIKTVAGGNGRGSGPNQLDSPKGIFVDNEGNLFIADQFNNRIQKWKPDGKTGITLVGGFDSNRHRLAYPSELFIDNQGNLFVADFGNHRIQMFAPGSTKGITVAGGYSSGSADNQLYLPQSLFVDQQGNLFIVDGGNHRIQKWVIGESAGVTVAGGNGAGSGLNQLKDPKDVFLDSKGNLIIADAGNHRIMKWKLGEESGVIIAGGNGAGPQANQLAFPFSISMNNQSEMFISNIFYNEVIKWPMGATSGVSITGKNGKNFAENIFLIISCVFVDEGGNIYFSDSGNNRIRKVTYQPQIIIPAGQTTGIMTVQGLEDLIIEEEEVATFEIARTTNGIISSSQSVLQVFIGNVPAAPEIFTSFQEVNCPNSTFTFSIPTVAQATSYRWGFLEMAPNATILPTSSTMATVLFQPGFSRVTLQVVASNRYGDSPKRSLELIAGTLPNTPGTIQASHLVVCQNSTRSYTVLPVDGALSYEWSYSGTGASFSNGGASIRVSYGASSTSGTWQVRAVGGCGSSEPRTLPVQMIPQNQLVQGPLTIRAAERRNEQATRSIILQPGASQQPITLEHGTVFSAQLVGCPVE